MMGRPPSGTVVLSTVADHDAVPLAAANVAPLSREYSTRDKPISSLADPRRVKDPDTVVPSVGSLMDTDGGKSSSGAEQALRAMKAAVSKAAATYPYRFIGSSLGLFVKCKCIVSNMQIQEIRGVLYYFDVFVGSYCRLLGISTKKAGSMRLRPRAYPSSGIRLCACSWPRRSPCAGVALSNPAWTSAGPGSRHGNCRRKCGCPARLPATRRH